MASKESTGLQAALIVFVLITVGLGIWVFLAQKQVTELKESEKQAKKLAQATDTRATFRQLQVDYLLHTTGFDEMEEKDIDLAFKEMEQIENADKTRFEEDFAKMNQVRTAFDQEVGTTNLVGGLAEGDYKHWRSINSYYEDISKHKANVAAKDVETQKAQKEQAEKARAEALAEKTKAENALKTEEAKVTKIDANYNEAVATFDKKTAEIEQLATNKDNKYKADTLALSKQIKDRNARIQTVENLNKGLAKRVQDMRTPDFDQPDGRITWVNQRSRTVWINLGLADGLYRQTTFSVFDKSDGSFARGQKEARVSTDERDNKKEFNIEDYAKAKIEVTRIIDRNLAEARIVSDDVSNPILPGDVIYTPAWVPGQTVKFALAGFMDYNNDGKSDRDIIRNLITVSGGKVVAEVKDDGEYVGDVTLDTRYLVLGERPTAKATDKDIRKSYGKIIGQAEDYGIEKIEFKKFLGFMGFKAEVKTVPLGGGSGSFEPRRPPSRGASGGAYK